MLCHFFNKPALILWNNELKWKIYFFMRWKIMRYQKAVINELNISSNIYMPVISYENKDVKSSTWFISKRIASKYS
jgi:hypothetical protein